MGCIPTRPRGTSPPASTCRRRCRQDKSPGQAIRLFINSLIIYGRKIWRHNSSIVNLCFSFSCIIGSVSSQLSSLSVSLGWSVGRSICHDILQGREVTFQCSFRSSCLQSYFILSCLQYHHSFPCSNF